MQLYIWKHHLELFLFYALLILHSLNFRNVISVFCVNPKVFILITITAGAALAKIVTSSFKNYIIKKSFSYEND